MTYCSYCGSAIAEGSNYCPNCGAPIKTTAIANTTVVPSGLGDYQVYISSLGTANRADVIDLLEDTLGYSSATAASIVDSLPAQIAGCLSLQQAAVIAQAFEEYGVQLTVTNGEEAADISSATSSTSLFSSDGSFLASAALILGSITAANRVSSIIRPRKPSLLDRIFHSLFGPKRRPPVHVRRPIHQRMWNNPPAPLQPARRAVRTAPVSGTPRMRHPDASHPSMNQRHSGHNGHGPGRH